MLPLEGSGRLFFTCFFCSLRVNHQMKDPSQAPPVTPLLHALTSSPNSSSAPDPATVTPTHFASLLFAHLLRSSPRAKTAARSVMPASSPMHVQDNRNIFIPADGTPAPAIEESDDDEPPQSLLQILSENLSLALLSRSRANSSDRESREWDRLVVGYLSLLSQWLWEDPKSVRDFLNTGGLGIVSSASQYLPPELTNTVHQLVEPINQTSEVDTIVPGLCALLLGICYEFNREPGEINRYSFQNFALRKNLISSTEQQSLPYLIAWGLIILLDK